MGITRNLILVVITLAAVGHAAFAENALPAFDVFAAQLPKYDYACDLQDYFDEPGLQAAMHVVKLPSNAEFNAELQKVIPQLYYRSIIELSALNPKLALGIYNNLKREPLRFTCSHVISKWSAGTVASTRRRWYLFGEVTINLGAFVATLVNHNKDDILFFNRSLLHETLHYFILNGKLLEHADNAVHTGGKNDMVYSCANFVWRPPPPSLLPIDGSLSPALRRELAAYNPKAPSVNDYLKFISTPEQMKAVEADILKYPERLLLHVFNYNQCMTCALTRATDNFAYRGGSPEEIREADMFCSAIAPKITIH